MPHGAMGCKGEYKLCIVTHLRNLAKRFAKLPEFCLRTGKREISQKESGGLKDGGDGGIFWRMGILTGICYLLFFLKHDKILC